MIATYEVTQTRGGKMSCRYFTPENAHHQVHMGNQIAPGVFADDGHEDVPAEHTRVCVHAASDGSGPPSSVAIVRKDSLGAAAPEPETESPKKRRKK